MNLAALFLCVGIFIFGLSTWLSPLLAWVFSRFKKTASVNTIEASDKKLTLEILIPAHNENESLPVTLKSLKSLQQAEFSTIKLVVGLSNWSGAEADRASQLADHRISIVEPGKWQALIALIENSTADWVALVDAGTVWPENILVKFTALFQNPQVIGINPKYTEAESGLMQRFVWGLESHLKNIENLSGGPISFHGSTIFYRRQELQEAIKILKTNNWWNDDVVVPLTLRKLNTTKKLVYVVNVPVLDMFPSSNISELNRRKRLLFGNLQWVQSLFLELLKTDLVLCTLALRRISRMLWAWSVSFIGLGLFFWCPELIYVFAVTVVTLALMPKGRRLYEAFWVSLMMPFYFVFHSTKLNKISWK